MLLAVSIRFGGIVTPPGSIIRIAGSCVANFTGTSPLLAGLGYKSKGRLTGKISEIDFFSVGESLVYACVYFEG